MDTGRLENIGGAFIDVVEDAAVAPNLGIKSRAASVEYSHDGPFATAKAYLISHCESGITVGGVTSDDQFGKAGLERATLNNLDVAAHGKNVGRNAAHLDVRVGAG